MFKSYNIDYLYSVVDVNKKIHICKLENNNYVDILSNELFSSISLEKIFPLKEFYPLKSKKVVSKKKLILKMYELVYYNYCINNNVSIANEAENEIISSAIKRFIHEKESLLEGHIFKDTNYITSYIQKNYFLDDIDFIKIYYYVKSDEYKKLVDDYINSIVKENISILFNKGYEEDDLSYEDMSYDVNFRKRLIENLSLLGIPEARIEEKIEKLSYLWRNQAMEFTYINRYHPVYKPAYDRKISDSVHKDKWISYRKYEYYKKHNESMVKYGEIEKDMLIGENDVEQLRKYLNRIDKERDEYLSSLGIYKEKVKR